jgi:hypothetical protein
MRPGTLSFLLILFAGLQDLECAQQLINSRENLHLILQDSNGVSNLAKELTPGLTSLSDPALKFKVPEKPYVVLKRGPIEVVIIDNRAVDDAVLPGHREGYHGIASLKHDRQNRNIFVPSYAGLNFEHIHDGTTQERQVLFEPRNFPMQLRVIDEYTAELYQAPTPHWRLESCLRYQLLNDGVIRFVFECVPHRNVFNSGYIGLFWASYIDHPESMDIHFHGVASGEASGASRWLVGTTPAHGVRATHLSVNDTREFRHEKDFPLTLVFNQSSYRYAMPWYFGVCRDMAFIQDFRFSDGVRFSQSPSGGGAGNPAWDFQWFIPDCRAGKVYRMTARVLYLPLPRGSNLDSARSEVLQALKRLYSKDPV